MFGTPIYAFSRSDHVKEFAVFLFEMHIINKQVD